MSEYNCPKYNFTGKATGTKTLPTVEESLKQATARQESLLKELRDIGSIHDTPIHDTTMTSMAPAPPVGDAELEQLFKIVSESGKIMQTAADLFQRAKEAAAEAKRQRQEEGTGLSAPGAATPHGDGAVAMTRPQSSSTTTLRLV